MIRQPERDVPAVFVLNDEMTRIEHALEVYYNQDFEGEHATLELVLERDHTDCQCDFEAESIAPPENHIEVIACCVMSGFRNMGVGGHLIEWLAREYPEDALTLDVLADNPAAIRLYQKCGFKVAEAFKGFSMEEATRPDCYHMIRRHVFYDTVS